MSATKAEQVGTWNGHSIPTFYNGVTFRSRTEARWAVFMDQLGVRWFYEHEGFALPSGWYVPDFWVPSINAYLEIKPSTFQWTNHLVPNEDMDLMEFDGPLLACGELCLLTGARTILTMGSPGEQQRQWCERGSCSLRIACCAGMDTPYHWCRCPACGKYGIEFEGRGGRVCDTPGHLDGKLPYLVGTYLCKDKAYGFEVREIHDAMDAAEKWRFR